MTWSEEGHRNGFEKSNWSCALLFLFFWVCTKSPVYARMLDLLRDKQDLSVGEFVVCISYTLYLEQNRLVWSKSVFIRHTLGLIRPNKLQGLCLYPFPTYRLKQ